MLVTAFLSMWLNNTATTAMMMPIAHAVLEELDVNRKRQLDGLIMDNKDGSRGNNTHPLLLSYD